jgi:hypothetical protein
MKEKFIPLVQSCYLINVELPMRFVVFLIGMIAFNDSNISSITISMSLIRCNGPALLPRSAAE